MSAAGLERAAALAVVLKDAGVAEIYVTQYKRNRQTAEPLARELGIPIAERPINAANTATYARDLAQEILTRSAGKTVLVVGHSNTVPDIVRALSGTAVPAITDAEYDHIFVVVIPAAGSPRLMQLRFGHPSPLLDAWNPALVDTVTRMGIEDQRGRDAVGRAVTANDTAVIFPMMRADSARSLWLRRVVRERGWPARGSVTDSAAQAAWLILQHSPFNDWQEEMLPKLEQLASVGQLPRQDLALLTDRILVHRGKPQRYGSQFDFVAGRMVPFPIEDLTGLDARRAAIGLMPMAEYARLLGELYKLPVVWPPSPTSR